MQNSFIKFRNIDSSTQIEEFVKRTIENLNKVPNGNQIDPYQVLDGFFQTMFRNLDFSKNFYFIENSGSATFTMNKMLDLEMIDFIYRAEEKLQSRQQINYRHFKDNHLVLEMLARLGDEVGMNLHHKTLGDSYVVTAPMFHLVEQMQTSFVRDFVLAFEMKFCEMPKMYKHTFHEPEDKYKYGSYWRNASVQIQNPFPVITNVTP